MNRSDYQKFSFYSVISNVLVLRKNSFFGIFYFSFFQMRKKVAKRAFCGRILKYLFIFPSILLPNRYLTNPLFFMFDEFYLRDTYSTFGRINFRE